MTYFIDFYPSVIQTASGEYKSIVPEKTGLEPSHNVFVAVIEELCRLCEGNEDCIGRLEAAMGMDYLALYSDDRQSGKEKVLAFSKAILNLLAAPELPWFVNDAEANSYVTELKEIDKIIKTRL